MDEDILKYDIENGVISNDPSVKGESFNYLELARIFGIGYTNYFELIAPDLEV